MENARRAAFSFFPMRSGGCAPEAFVVAKQPSAALSVTRRKFRHMTCGALAAFWKVEIFISMRRGRAWKKRARRTATASLPLWAAYRASTFEITNLSAQKTRYVSGPLKRLSCPSASFLFFSASFFFCPLFAAVFPRSDFFYSVTNVFSNVAKYNTSHKIYLSKSKITD